MKLIIYTNSEYKDIFSITRDHLKNLNKDNIIIFSDYSIDDYQTIIYDNNNTYPQRIIQCFNNLNHINIEYILFCHDNDIIISQINI